MGQESEDLVISTYTHTYTLEYRTIYTHMCAYIVYTRIYTHIHIYVVISMSITGLQSPVGSFRFSHILSSNGCECVWEYTTGMDGVRRM